MQTKKPDLARLEDRILFDVAPLDVHAQDLQPELIESPSDGSPEAGFDWSQNQVETSSLLAVDSSAEPSTAQTLLGQLDELSFLLDEHSDGPEKQLIVIDQSVEDFSLLIDQAIGDADPGSYEILLVDPAESALERINDRLSADVYSAVHIVAHGQDGQIVIGNEKWDSDFLAENREHFAQWQNTLPTNSDLYFYGCDLAATSSGQDFVREVAEVTGMDVAASSDVTGSNSLGGDWQLEFRVGEFDSQSLFHEFSLDAWNYTLGAIPVNTAPTAVDDAFAIDEGGELTVTESVFKNDLDADGDLLVSGSLVVGPEHGTLTWNVDGTFVYQHDGSENHADSFQYEVSDGNGGTSIGKVEIDITPVNDAPIAKGEMLRTNNLTPLVVSAAEFLANDFDAEGDSLIVYIVKGPRNGTIEIVDGKLVYTPDVDFVGKDRIRYFVYDGEHKSNTVAMRFKVSAAPPPAPVPDPVDVPDPGSEDDSSSNDDSGSDDSGAEEDANANDGNDDGGLSNLNLPSPLNQSFNNSDGEDGQNESNSDFNFLIVDQNELDLEAYRSVAQDNRYSFTSASRTVSYITTEADSSLQFETEDSSETNSIASDNNDYSSSLIFDNMSRELDSFDRDFKIDGSVDQVTYATLSSITSVLTVGYVMWMVRGGMLMASFVSSLPAWQSVDPLNIVAFGAEVDADTDGESLESIVNQFSSDA